LTAQAKNKYNSPKYRLVVRMTCSDIIVQVAYPKIQGDEIICAAYSHELPKYGIKVGLTNWAAAYATGLLAARRLLTKLGLADKYEGQVEADGEMFEIEPLEDGPRPFRAYLDVGLRRTTTGSRVFAAMKGAVDGGLAIPHGENRFPGYDTEAKKLDAETLRRYIFGGHVADYMNELKDEDEEAFKRQFARYLEEGIDGDDLEDIYKEAHAAIRANPVAEKKAVDESVKKGSKPRKAKKLNLKQRQDKVKQKKAAFLRSLAEA
jgi:large subunit ribosomal protein L5e